MCVCLCVLCGGTLNVSSNVGLDPASTFYSPKISGISGIPKNI